MRSLGRCETYKFTILGAVVFEHQTIAPKGLPLLVGPRAWILGCHGHVCIYYSRTFQGSGSETDLQSRVPKTLVGCYKTVACGVLVFRADSAGVSVEEVLVL